MHENPWQYIPTMTVVLCSNIVSLKCTIPNYLSLQSSKWLLMDEPSLAVLMAEYCPPPLHCHSFELPWFGFVPLVLSWW